jgi:hypothetical protein
LDFKFENLEKSIKEICKNYLKNLV